MKIGQHSKRMANRNGRPLRSAIVGLETSSIWLLWLLVVLMCFTVPSAIHGQPTRQDVIAAMAKATRFFQSEVATEGGYLWRYREDMSMREGEGRATESMVWVQPPGTPAVGIAYLDAFAATGDSLYLNGAVSVARALVWGQLSTGGWDYRIDFDPEKGKRWH